MTFEEKIWEALQKVKMRQEVQVEIVPNPPKAGKTLKVVTAETDDGEKYQFYINNSPKKTAIYVYEKDTSGKYAGEGISLSEGEGNPFITYYEMFRHYANAIIRFLSDIKA